MFHLFQKGGPIMWPLFLTSVVSLAVILERIFFIIREKFRRDPQTVENMLAEVSQGNIGSAIERGEHSGDFVARVMTHGLRHVSKSYSSAVLHASGQELRRFQKGLPVLDTVITLAPLLGLLSTVTGMIHAFGILGNRELDTPTVITGGISEALIGTAFGLAIAVMALIPFNYLNTCLESARQEIEDHSTRLELLLKLMVKA